MTDTRTPPPVRANRSQRKRKAPLALIVIPLVLVAAAGGLFYFLSGGEAKIPFIDDDNGSTEVPAFEFKVRKTRVVVTDPEADATLLAPQAEAAGAEIVPQLQTLFTDAFLDPENWRDGNYAEVWAHFSTSAQQSAQEQVETLTLGANAGDVYDEVVPTKGSLEFNVLFDQAGQPTSVAVKFRFYAFATRSDGTFVAIVSHGQLFMDDSGSWVITAFDVKRNDREAESPPPPTPGPSGSASASAPPS